MTPVAAGDVVEHVERRSEGRGRFAQMGVEGGLQAAEGGFEVLCVAQAVAEVLCRGVVKGGVEAVEGEPGAVVGAAGIARVGPGGLEVGEGIAPLGRGG